jgi:hypothetical protein
VRSLLRSSSARALGKLALRTLPPLRPALHTWRARYETAELDTGAAVLVYQMGKVGSGSVMRALEAEAVPAFHVHNLAPDQLTRSGELHRNAFGRFDIDYTWYIGCALSRRIQAAPPGRRFRVITLVRDPIAREVSGIFQVPELYGPDLVDAERRFDVERVLARLRVRFCEEPENGCGYTFTWFDREVRAVLGVDVLGSPFPRERGYTVLTGERASVLVLRTEDLDQTLVPGLEELLGVRKHVAAPRANVRDDEGRAAAAYREVRERLRLPREVVRQIYAHPFVRHFYPDAMIERFAARWTEKPRG